MKRFKMLSKILMVLFVYLIFTVNEAQADLQMPLAKINTNKVSRNRWILGYAISRCLCRSNI